jgi:uncharacterized membrane protein
MKLKRLTSSSFLGKQLSRLKMGQSYYAIITSTISTVSLVTLAFEINIWIIVFLFPFLLFTTFAIGYYLDVRNINSIDTLKSNEMAHRFLNKGDIKNQEFQMMQTTILVEAIINAIKKGKDFDPNTIWQRYEEYRSKWKLPDY